jgi:ABC-type glycerol-3-phosphate transport system substrate-binding protein
MQTPSPGSAVERTTKAGPAGHPSICGGETETMNTKLRVLGVFAGLAIVLGACSTPGATSPAGSAGSPAASASTPASGGSSEPGAALSGELTVWHSYGSGAGTEATAL